VRGSPAVRAAVALIDRKSSTSQVVPGLKPRLGVGRVVHDASHSAEPALQGRGNPDARSGLALGEWRTHGHRTAPTIADLHSARFTLHPSPFTLHS